MNDGNLLRICKDFISIKFKVDDLKHCLQILGCNTSGKKDELKRRLITAIDSTKLRDDALKVVSNRASILVNFSIIPQEHFIESVERKTNTSSSSSSRQGTSSNIHSNDKTLMKKLYFHKDVVSITPWKSPTYNDINNTVFINCNIPNNISINSLTSTKTEVAQNCVMLRSLKLTYVSDDDSENEPQEDTYPLFLRLYVNGTEYSHLLPREVFYSSADKRYRVNLPTILNEALLDNREIIENNRTLKVELRYDNAPNKANRFIFCIFTSTQRSVKEICDEIKSREKLDFARFRQDLEKFMSTSSDIRLEFAKISLLSSTTLMRINIPFRGKNCNHLSPDDLEEYIRSNQKSEAWKCKICNAKCTPDDIFIDEFYMDLLNKHKKAEEIELFPDMSYKLVGGVESKQLMKPKSPKRKKISQEIIVLDSDDEDDSDDYSSRSSGSSSSSIKTQSPVKCEIPKEKSVEKNTCTKIQQPTVPQKKIEYIVIDDSSDEEEKEPLRKKNRLNDDETSKNKIIKPTLISNTCKIDNQRSPSDGFLSDDSILNDAVNNDLVMVLDDDESEKSTDEIITKNMSPFFEEFVKKIVGNDPCNTKELFFNSQKDKDLPSNTNTPVENNIVAQDSTISNNSNTDMSHLCENSQTIKDYFKMKNDEIFCDLDEFIKSVEKITGFIPPSSH